METSKALTIFREQLKKFVEFNEAEWIVFIQHLSFSTLKKKRFFAEYGKVCNNIGFIVKGSVRYYLVKDGEELQAILALKTNL